MLETIQHIWKKVYVKNIAANVKKNKLVNFYGKQ